MNNKKLMEIFQSQKLDVIYSTAQQTRLWYAKVNTSAGFLFIEPEKATLFLDGRYFEYGSKNAQNVEVKLYQKVANLETFVQAKKYQSIGIEADYLTVSELNFIQKLAPHAKLVHIKGQELRIIKSPAEIELMAEAGKCALRALNNVKHLIKPGVKESTIDAELEKEIRLLGGEKGSFDAIVASGERSALPHGRASNRVLKENELVTIDFGAIYQGYCSDITRTFHVGKVSDQKLLAIEKVVREAQKRGVAAVKPGISTGEIDKVCRDYITEHGYGEYFVHSTGHGLGIDVHELPYVSSVAKFTKVLEPGMVITVEPGIYLPGYGGIRVEDDVLVTKDGHRVLSTLGTNE